MQTAINTEHAEIQAVAMLNDLDPVSFAAYLRSEGYTVLEDAAQEYECRYAGTWESLEAWAEEHADDTGMLESIPQDLRYYFDFAAWARDQELNGYIWSIELPNGSVAVFWP